MFSCLQEENPFSWYNAYYDVVEYPLSQHDAACNAGQTKVK